MPRSSSSKIFSIMGKMAKRWVAGFDLRALRSLVSTGGKRNKVELHTILQIQSTVRLYLHNGMFYNSSGNSSSRCKLPHDSETHTCAVKCRLQILLKLSHTVEPILRTPHSWDTVALCTMICRGSKNFWRIC